MFLPLVPTRPNSPSRFTEPASMIVSNDAQKVLFTPRFLPITGIYNDYGSLEHIRRDVNVEYIEDYFGITIDEFMEQVSRNWCGDKEIKCKTDEKTRELQHLSGMFENNIIVERMVKKFPDGETRKDLRFDIKENRELLAMDYEYGSKILTVKGWRHLMYALEPVFNKLLFKHLCFDNIMFRTNNMYMPVMSGPQCGDYHISWALANATKCGLDGRQYRI
jgi:hypothetical protein